MFQLLWGILNLTIILCFFYFLIGLVVKGRKFLVPYSKVFTVPILVFGILGFLNSTVKRDKSSPGYKGFSAIEVIDVVENLSNKIHLVLIRDKETGEIFHEGSFSSISGFVMGLEWRHFGIIKKNKTLEVSGYYQYKFMGLNVFSSFETYVIEDNNPDLD